MNRNPNMGAMPPRSTKAGLFDRVYRTPALLVMAVFSAAAVALLRERYPGKHLHVLIQPHRYARLAQYFDRFAAELRKADSVSVSPVFAAWTETGDLGSAELAAAIGPQAEYLSGSWEEIGNAVLQHPVRPMVLAVLGAGDVEKVFQFLPSSAAGQGGE